MNPLKKALVIYLIFIHPKREFWNKVAKKKSNLKWLQKTRLLSVVKNSLQDTFLYLELEQISKYMGNNYEHIYHTLAKWNSKN